MSRVVECVALCRLLVYGGGYHGVNISGLEVSHGSLEGVDGGLARFGRGYACLDVEVLVAALDHVDFAASRLCGRSHGRELCAVLLLERSGIICRSLRRAVDHGGEQFGDTRIGEGAEDNLPAYAVGVALGNSYLESVIRHTVQQWFQSANI